MKVESESRGPRNCSPHGNQVETCMLCSLGLHGARHPPSTGTLLFTSGISRPMQNDCRSNRDAGWCWRPEGVLWIGSGQADVRGQGGQEVCYFRAPGTKFDREGAEHSCLRVVAAKVKWSDPKRCPLCHIRALLAAALQISNGLAQAPRSWQITMPTGKTHPHYTHWLAEAQKMRRSEKKRQTEFQQDLSIMYIQ